ncbi:kinesin-like protein KIF20A isoform X2 [Ascaphus truei]|uniref:kinesin-like protein KIF20A isoform X2 n=1 Tax=Ascaphus truei TaxID=8439 RepID=UPI003F5944B4
MKVAVSGHEVCQCARCGVQVRWGQGSNRRAFAGGASDAGSLPAFVAMDTREESAGYCTELVTVLDSTPCASGADALDSELSGSDNQACQPLKVYLRVRPFSKAELAGYESQGCVTIENSEMVTLQAPKDSSALKNSERGVGQSVHKFTFTRIFGPETMQAEFFESTMKDLVHSFAGGQNGLVFTYGVTNAGKTFTIQGSPKDGGILPRSLDVIFNHIKGRQYPKMNLKPHLGSDVMKLDAAQVKQEEAMKASLLATLKEDERGMKIVPCESISIDSACRYLAAGDRNSHQFSAWVSFFEIYNEYVYDLLDQFTSSKNQKRPPLKICDDQAGNSYVKDLKWLNITSTEEACKILQIGNKNRSLASTRMNQQSSRRMSLCDLAGSERCNKTQTIGDRLREAGNINNSLLILGKCIAALKQSQNPKKPSNVPFRESKLTRLFQPFFCGKGRACMIVNINQCASTYDETLHVMKFSAVAKQVVQSIQPRNFDFMIPRLVGKDGKAVINLDDNLSFDELLSDDEEDDIDITILSAEDLLKKIEDLRAKLIAERQSKLILELQIRKEMGEAMYQQMVDLDETWSKRFEDLKETYDEQLETRLELYKQAIKNHAYHHAMEEIEEHYVPFEEFEEEQGKVEVRDNRILELEIALGLGKDPGGDGTSAGLHTMSSALDVRRQCQEKGKVIASLKIQIQTIKDEAALAAKQLTEENNLLQQQLKIKEQELEGLQSLAERAPQLETAVTELQAELDEIRKISSSMDLGQPKTKKGLFSNIKSTLTGTPKKSSGKSLEKLEETPTTSRKRPILARK